MVISKKLVLAVQKMHKLDILHRDLHLKNVMIQFKHLAPTIEEMDSPVDFFELVMP